MSSLASLPIEVKINILQYLSNDDFIHISMLSRGWNQVCHFYKFPLDQLSLSPANANEKQQLNVTISGGRLSGGSTSAEYKQIAHSAIETPSDGSINKTEENDVSYRSLAIDYFFRTLKQYRVARVHVDLCHLADIIALLIEKTSKEKYKCESLIVTDATYEQIKVLSQSIRANGYTLNLASHLHPQPIPMNANIIRCPGTLSTRGLFASEQIQLPSCSTLKIRANCSISLSILEKWALDWKNGVKDRKRLIEISGLKADFDELKALVKRHSSSYTHFTRYEDPSGGAPFVRLACGFVDSEGEMAILEFEDDRKGDGYYAARFFASCPSRWK